MGAILSWGLSHWADVLGVATAAWTVVQEIRHRGQVTPALNNLAQKVANATGTPCPPPSS